MYEHTLPSSSPNIPSDGIPSNRLGRVSDLAWGAGLEGGSSNKVWRAVGESLAKGSVWL